MNYYKALKIKPLDDYREFSSIIDEQISAHIIKINRYTGEKKKKVENKLALLQEFNNKIKSQQDLDRYNDSIKKKADNKEENKKSDLKFINYYKLLEISQITDYNQFNLELDKFITNCSKKTKKAKGELLTQFEKKVVDAQAFKKAIKSQQELDQFNIMAVTTNEPNNSQTSDKSERDINYEQMSDEELLELVFNANKKTRNFILVVKLTQILCSRNPNSMYYKYLLGNGYFNSKQYQQAKNTFELAVNCVQETQEKASLYQRYCQLMYEHFLSECNIEFFDQLLVEVPNKYSILRYRALYIMKHIDKERGFNDLLILAEQNKAMQSSIAITLLKAVEEIYGLSAYEYSYTFTPSGGYVNRLSTYDNDKLDEISAIYANVYAYTASSKALDAVNAIYAFRNERKFSAKNHDTDKLQYSVLMQICANILGMVALVLTGEYYVYATATDIILTVGLIVNGILVNALYNTEQNKCKYMWRKIDIYRITSYTSIITIVVSIIYIIVKMI